MRGVQCLMLLDPYLVTVKSDPRINLKTMLDLNPKQCRLLIKPVTQP